MAHMDALEISLRAGGTAVSTKAVFTNDSKCVLVVSGDAVLVYSAGTGHCVRRLVHGGSVSGLALHPTHHQQIFTTCLNGELSVWDISNGNRLKTVSVGTHIASLVDASGDGKSVYLIRHIEDESPESGHELVRHSLASGSSQVLMSPCHQDARRCAIGPKEKFVACVLKDALKIWTPKQKKRENIVHSVGSNYELTCVTSHPEGHCVATGRSDGQILLWWNFLCLKTVESTKMHWHSLPVACLQYTPDGALLLSGGGECVLVQWRHGTTDRSFLPRLGSPLSHLAVSPDTRCYATCHQDNSVRIIGHNMVVRHVLVGLTVAGLCGEKVAVPTGLLCDPRTLALVLNGQPGHLQFYDVHNDQHLYNLDILGQNYVSWDSVERPECVTQVTGASFSAAGDWLATVEHWDNGVSPPESALRFWQYSAHDKQFVLNTLVEQPHESQAVSCLRFRQPLRQRPPVQLVSVGQDGKFRLWELLDTTDAYGKSMQWTCQYAGHWRHEMPSQADFSADGSVLAVGFGASVTLWEPDCLEFHRELTDYRDPTPIRHLAMGRHSASDLVVSASARHLTVWKPLLLTGPILWSLELEVAVLTLDPCSSVMAVVSTDSKLTVYQMEQSSPVYTHPQPVSKGGMAGAVFVPRGRRLGGEEEGGAAAWQKQSELFLLTDKQELLSIAPPNQHLTQSQQVGVMEGGDQSALSLLIMGQRLKSLPQTAVSSLDHLRHQRNKMLRHLCAEYTAPSLSSSLACLLSPATPARREEGTRQEEAMVMGSEDSD